MSLIPEIDLEKCIGCGECVEWCPAHAVVLLDGKAAIERPENCNYCAECESFCSSGAIRCPFDIVLVKLDPPS